MKIRKFETFNENRETNNYMFFQNLHTMKEMIDELLEMNEQEIDMILDEHDWASDHISTSKDDVEEVYHFITKNK